MPDGFWFWMVALVVALGWGEGYRRLRRTLGRWYRRRRYGNEATIGEE